MLKRIASFGAIAGLVLGIVVLTPPKADASAQAGVAVPGSALAGYATPVITVAKDAPFNFVNTDALAPHDLVSVKSGSVRGQFLFASEVIGAPATSEVKGMENTETGQTYEFYCTIHPATMRGTLVVV